MRILVLQGPNMHRLGHRQPAIYGRQTLADVEARMDEVADVLGSTLEHYQSNHEGGLIDWLSDRQANTDALICNPAGLTPYGLSLRDALHETGKPLAVVHLSNVHARETWRRHDVFAEIATLYLAGLGWQGYLHAVRALHERA